MFEETNAERKIYVKLHTNQFDKESYVGMVPRNTLSMDAVVTEITKNNPGIGKFAVYHSAELIKEEIMNQLATGCAVSVLDLGTMYIGVSGKIEGSDPSPADIPDFTIRFTPSPKVQETLSSVVADGIMYADEAPVINTVEDFLRLADDGILHSGTTVRITGRKLKVGGNGSGIFFVPVDSDGKPVTDEKIWTGVDTSVIPQNLPKSLIFALPSALEKDIPYFIAVRTACTSGNKMKKENATGFSQKTVKIEK
jgi:hypothetical protein